MSDIEKIMGNDLSHLNTLDLEELNSFKNLAIEQSVDPTLNEFQKASLIWVANYIESLMVQRSGIYWLSNNFTLPTESANIVYTNPITTAISIYFCTSRGFGQIHIGGIICFVPIQGYRISGSTADVDVKLRCECPTEIEYFSGIACARKSFKC